MAAGDDARANERRTSAMGRYGRPPSPMSRQAPTRTRQPALRARWAAVATRLVLPMPASPVTIRKRADPASTAALAAATVASSRSRPTGSTGRSWHGACRRSIRPVATDHQMRP